MSFDPLQKLADTGHAVDLLSEDQKAALSTLTEHEIDVLTSVETRLAHVGGEVEGQDFILFRVG
jgi:hypothetical protein